MHHNPSSDVRWTVAGKLYSHLQKLVPGTREAEIIEHAISLALNSGRQSRSVTFLYQDVMRNARYSMLRTLKRRSVLLEFTAYSVDV